ncbi:MAG TPA: GNAT family protein [Thermomicrobiales bacterium]|jgi:RimJ/RimL family protein N-acetyltransferase|nr:GNAT family protein [Thermomicrobiales bacterium]
MPMPPPGTVIETLPGDGHAGLVIRTLTPGDAPALLTYINTLSTERTFILLQGVQLTLEQEQAWLGDRLAEQASGDGLTLAIVADQPSGQRVVGVAGVARGGLLQRHVGVLGISLAADIRGRGFGSRLFGAILREAGRHIDGLRLFQLDVIGTNDVARSLYRRHGFIDYALLPGGIHHGDDWADLVSMYRPVGSPGSREA